VAKGRHFGTPLEKLRGYAERNDPWAFFRDVYGVEPTQEQDELLELFADANFNLVFIGIESPRKESLEETRKNLSAMIEQSQAAGAKVILAEMRIPPNYGQTYTEKFAATYALMIEEYDIMLLPFMLESIALESGMMQDDGIHPAIEAQPILVDKVWVLLEPQLQ